MASWLDDARLVGDAPAWLKDAKPAGAPRVGFGDVKFAEKPPVPGALETFADHAVNGAALNQMPRVMGAAAAGAGARGGEVGDTGNPLMAAGDVVAGLYHKLRGDPMAESRYATAERGFRDNIQQGQLHHPAAAFTGEAAGAALPAGAITKAVPLIEGAGRLPRLLNAMRQGAAVGAVLGLGEDNPVSGAVGGGVTGAAAGLTLPLLVESAGRAVKPLVSRLENAADYWGRRAITGGYTPISNQPELSPAAVREGYRSRAIAPFRSTPAIAEALDANAEEAGGLYAKAVRTMGEKGIRVEDVRPLIANLRQRAAEVEKNDINSEAANKYRELADHLEQRIVRGPGTPPEVVGVSKPLLGAVAPQEPVLVRTEPPTLLRRPNGRIVSPRQRGPLVTPLTEQQDFVGPITRELNDARTAATPGALNSVAADTETPLDVALARAQGARDRVGQLESELDAVKHSSPDNTIRDPATRRSRLLPDTNRPQPDSGWAPVIQEGTPDDFSAGLEQMENIKRRQQWQARAHYSPLKAETALGDAATEKASMLRQTVEDAVAAGADKAPEEAAAFIPLKHRAGAAIEARDAALKAAARMSRHKHLSLTDELMKGAMLAHGGPLAIPEALATGEVSRFARMRGPATYGWMSNEGADLLRGIANASPDAPVGALVPAAEATPFSAYLADVLRRRGPTLGYEPIPVQAEDDR